jgi:hypothetical protein
MPEKLTRAMVLAAEAVRKKQAYSEQGGEAVIVLAAPPLI